jgi:DNA primase
LRDFERHKRAILDRVGIVDLVSAHVTLKRSGQRFVGLCPFHTEKTPSFTVNPDLGIFKCFGCGKGGDIFKFIQLRENVSFMEAMSMLADRAGVQISQTEGASAGRSKSEFSKNDLVRVNAWAEQYFRSLLDNETIGQAARDYLCGRGFNDETLKRFGVGLAVDEPNRLTQAATKAGIAPALLIEADLLRQSDDGRTYDTFRSRIMFPIRDPMNRVIGFGGRTLIDDKAKYLNTRQNTVFDKGRTLYGIDIARNAISDRGRTVVVEGYTDCLAAHQAGFRETVATLGTALTESHVELMRRYGDEVILLFDSDQAGETAADRAIHVALPRSVRVRLARIPAGKDPSEFLVSATPSEFSDVLNDACDALEFKWIQTRERFGGDSSDARRRDAVLDFLRVVNEAASQQALDVIQRGLLVNHTAHLLGMTGAEVDALMRRMERAVRRPGDDTPGPRSQSRAMATASAEQTAWSRVLEVGLNEPRWLMEADERIGLDRIPTESDRRLARMVTTVVTRGGEYRLADVLAQCEPEDDTERVATLAETGARRGNFEATFRDALARLGRMYREEEIKLARDRFLGHRAGDDEDFSADDSECVRRGMKEHRHFAPRRLIRSARGPSAPE